MISVIVIPVSGFTDTDMHEKDGNELSYQGGKIDIGLEPVVPNVGSRYLLWEQYGGWWSDSEKTKEGLSQVILLN